MATESSQNAGKHSLERRATSYCCYESVPRHPCVCAPIERVLRALTDDQPGIMPLTEAEREYLIAEADWAGEGSYPANEANGLSDKELARWVLSAWHEYATSNVEGYP